MAAKLKFTHGGKGGPVLWEEEVRSRELARKLRNAGRVKEEAADKALLPADIA